MGPPMGRPSPTCIRASGNFLDLYAGQWTRADKRCRCNRRTIQELFDAYGRMNSTLGTELPFTNINTQTTVVLKYLDPPSETVIFGQPQLWKITHNGVDTHSIHFHLFNVQIVNRVGWDGAVRPPDANEIGWKETVRMHPLGRLYRGGKAGSSGAPLLGSRQHTPAGSDESPGHHDAVQRHRPDNRNPDYRHQPIVQLWLGVRVALPPPGPRRERHDAAYKSDGDCHPRSDGLSPHDELSKKPQGAGDDPASISMVAIAA